jgi:peptidoglycan/LPS O-acetylase OafA/YrhL
MEEIWINGDIWELGGRYFFTTSGFLLALSLLAKQNIIGFVFNRILRIFPGLVFSLFLTLVITGTFFTTLDFTSFIKNEQTKAFLVSNSILLFGVAYILPGAFQANPVLSVNGSLWTLPYELSAYIALVLVASLSLISKRFFAKTFKVLLFALCVYIYIRYIKYFYGGDTNFEKYRLYFFFFFGACVGTSTKYIKLDMRWGFVCLVLIVLSLPYSKLLFPIYTILLPYVVLTLAYVPTCRRGSSVSSIILETTPMACTYTDFLFSSVSSL